MVAIVIWLESSSKKIFVRTLLEVNPVYSLPIMNRYYEDQEKKLKNIILRYLSVHQTCLLSAN